MQDFKLLILFFLVLMGKSQIQVFLALHKLQPHFLLFLFIGRELPYTLKNMSFRLHFSTLIRTWNGCVKRISVE